MFDPPLCLDVINRIPSSHDTRALLSVSLTRVTLDVVVDDLLPAVGQVHVVHALGVLALAGLLVAVGRVVGIHLVPESVVGRAEMRGRYTMRIFWGTLMTFCWK